MLLVSELCLLPSNLSVHLELSAAVVAEPLELVVAFWPETAFSIGGTWLQVRELR